MHSLQTFDGLDFHYHQTFYQEIDAVAAIECSTAVNNRQGFLSLDG